MHFKCPHCQVVNEYSERECREIFIRCKSCKRDFRASESSPLTASLNGLQTDHAIRKLMKMSSMPPEERTKRKNVAKLNAEAAIYIKRGECDRAAKELRESLRQKPNQPKVERLLQKIDAIRESDSGAPSNW